MTVNRQVTTNTNTSINNTLFETVAIVRGRIVNLSYHNRRFVAGQLFLGCRHIIHDLQPLIDAYLCNNPIKNTPSSTVRRGRITYANINTNVNINANTNNYDNAKRTDTVISVECFDYTPKPINRLKIIHHNNLDYRYKYSDRRVFARLLATAQASDAVDEIIIINHGQVSDCTIGNLLFWQNGRWYTPSTPLLCGTQRQFLLEQGRIALADISVDELKNYEKLMMVNALNPFDERRALPMTCVIA